MVGRAVRNGTEGRGGRFYQFLAVFLTYSAIVLMYVPFVLEGFGKQAPNERQAKIQVAKADKDGRKPEARSKVPDAGKDGPSGAKVDGQIDPAAAPKVTSIDSAVVPPEKTAAVDHGGPRC